MHSDSSFREETMRDYLSRLGILEGWIEESSYNVYYPFQIDEVVLSKFMDYVLIERNCSSQTYNNYLAWLRTFCGWMQQRRYIHDNPTVGLKSIRRTTAKNRTVIPDQTLIKVRTYLEQHNKHFLLASYILHYIYVRPHEMSLLRIGDFRLEKKTLILHGDQTKNHHDAVLTLPDFIVELMVELKVFDHPSQEYLFSDGCRPGKTWRDSKQFRDYWNNHVRKDLKLPAEYKFYSLKDTGITNMLRARTDPISVRDQARHSSLLITNTYTPLDIKEANPLILKYRGVF
jgi:integrase